MTRRAPASRPEARAARLLALRVEALAALAAITDYVMTLPADAGWPVIEEQADINSHLRRLRDQVLREGEFAPSAAAGAARGDKLPGDELPGDELPGDELPGDELPKGTTR